MTIKTLKNNYDKEIEFENLEEAKAYFLISEEQLKDLTDNYEGDDFEYNKKRVLQREQDIKDANDLEELADVLNDYSDNYDNGSTWFVQTLNI